jgi:hypothetical protein
MAWGDRFSQLFNDASDAAKAAATSALSSAKAAAKAVAQAAVDVGEAVVDAGVAAAKAAARTAVAAGKAVANTAVAVGQFVADKAVGALHVAGEVLNFVVSFDVITTAYLFSAVAYPFRRAAKLFSPTKSPPETVVVQCPGAEVDIFNNAYRKTLIDSKFAGADSPALRQAMNELLKNNPENVDKALAVLAKERGRPLEQIKQEYETYLEKRTKVDDAIAHSNGKLEPIDQLLPGQSDFMGSNWQMRYGKIVGDQFGIDPVFGAMLNPTGGMVGPGNKGLAPDAWYMPTPVAYHGAYHDATGYLFNYHKTGPGYNYMNSPIGLSTDNPLAGQGTGIAQWTVNTLL